MLNSFFFQLGFQGIFLCSKLNIFPTFLSHVQLCIEEPQGTRLDFNKMLNVYQRKDHKFSNQNRSLN